jgi:hypothetical protein
MKNETTRDAAVTICAINYLSKALVLQESYKRFHPDNDFFILLIDMKNDRVERSHPDTHFLWFEDLDIPNKFKYALMYDIIELNTNVKPSILKQLLKNYNTVLYIDPDIEVFGFLGPVYQQLEKSSIVVTPHTLTPILDGHNPSDIDFSRFGSYNLGFLGVRQCDEALRFLDWWSERCLKLGFYEPQSGLAVDQKWIDLAPSFFPDLWILRNPGLNVAFWNLHERKLSCKDGVWYVNEEYPLYFFHFSSFNEHDFELIANKQDRFVRGGRPDVIPLAESYAAKIRACPINYSALRYSFDYFDTGYFITATTRRVYATLVDRFPDENPLSADSSFYRFARKKGLARASYKAQKRENFKDLDKHSLSIKMYNCGLRLLFRAFGAQKYFAAMRYMAYISSIRNQKDVFLKEKYGS